MYVAAQTTDGDKVRTVHLSLSRTGVLSRWAVDLSLTTGTA